MQVRRKKRRNRGVKRRPRIEVIYAAQKGICYLCGTRMPSPRDEWISCKERPSIDHVVPKHPDEPKYACPRIRKNGLVCHHKCNNSKGNRLPYPCELLFLDIINEKMESTRYVYHTLAS